MSTFREASFQMCLIFGTQFNEFKSQYIDMTDMFSLSSVLFCGSLAGGRL